MLPSRRALRAIAAPYFLPLQSTLGPTRARPIPRATGGAARVTRGETISGSASTVISSGLPELSKPRADFGSGGLPSLLDFALLIIYYGAARQVIFIALVPVRARRQAKVPRLLPGEDEAGYRNFR